MLVFEKTHFATENMSQKCQFDFNYCRDGCPELRNVIDIVIDTLCAMNSQVL